MVDTNVFPFYYLIKSSETTYFLELWCKCGLYVQGGYDIQQDNHVQMYSLCSNMFYYLHYHFLLHRYPLPLISIISTIFYSPIQFCIVGANIRLGYITV